MRKRERSFSPLQGILMPLLLLCVLLAFFTALRNFSSGSSDEERQQLESALRRAAVACYAAEGIYPPNAAYLEERYGVQIDHGRYLVHYDIFANNLMPDITVSDR